MDKSCTSTSISCEAFVRRFTATIMTVVHFRDAIYLIPQSAHAVPE